MKKIEVMKGKLKLFYRKSTYVGQVCSMLCKVGHIVAFEKESGMKLAIKKWN